MKFNEILNKYLDELNCTSKTLSNVSGISNSEENDNRDNDSQYQDPENIVFEDDISATIDLPVDDIKVTFDGKELMPGRDTAEEIKASFPDTFTDVTTNANP